MKKIFYILAFLILWSAITYAQTNFSVTVLSAVDSLAVAGAEVTVTPSNKRGTTDQSGKFNFSSIDGSNELTIRHIGYEPFKRRFELPGSTYTIYLVPASNTIQTVEINTGYQTIPKERATGSFVTVSNKQLSEQFSTDIL
ncbi:MAG: hypothetical protein EOO97_00910, partial [Pedobacter sp.]